MSKKRVTIAEWDGIGPEIMQATLRVLEAAKAGEHLAMFEAVHGSAPDIHTFDGVVGYSLGQGQ